MDGRARGSEGHGIGATEQPRARRSRRLAAPLAAALLAALCLVAVSAQAAPIPQLLWQNDIGGNARARNPVASPVDGRIYLSNVNQARIDAYSAWGIFERAWGWDVVDTGPGDTPADEFEICVPADGDTCKSGIDGPSGAGQLNDWAALAVDSAGNIYAADTPGWAVDASRRVQKFSGDGEFLLMFGGGVNQGGGTPSNPGDVCTAEHLANGDTCGVGTEGTGPAEFSSGSGLRANIAIGPDDDVYVGDAGRIQVFDSGGTYQDEITVPGEDVGTLAVDASGFPYAGYQNGSSASKPDVRKLDPGTGDELLSLEVDDPRGIAVAADADVYVLDDDGGEFSARAAIRRFDSSGEVAEVFTDDLPKGANGLAVNDVTGEGGIAVYFGNAVNSSYLRAYSPIPDPDIVGLPPALAPDIEDQWAGSVLPRSAALTTQVNPLFWEDATYYLEYGGEECKTSGFTSGCTQLPADPKPLDAGVRNTAVTRSFKLTGLDPETTYHYRFVAESSGGGPTFGPEQSFNTLREAEATTDCPNQELREGVASHLPDCRAWEMVSPVDKNGSNVMVVDFEGFDTPTTDIQGFDQSAPGGERLAYSSGSVFANAVGAPIASMYLAERGEESWGTRSLNPPMKGGDYYFGSAEDYKAFSESLTTGWLVGPTGLPLSDPGPVEGFPNIYRRDNLTDTYTWLESTGPEPAPCGVPGCDADGVLMFPELQGFSADGSEAVFAVNDLLTADAVEGFPAGENTAPQQLYHWSEDDGVRLISVLPDGTPYEGRSTAGSRVTGFLGSHERAAVNGQITTVMDAVSDDAETIYWGPTLNTSGSAAGRLYVRINADMPQSAVSGGECTEPEKACTLPVSEAVPTPAAVQFWGATPDGTEAIFSVIGGGQLYSYDLDAEDTDFITSGVVGVADTSDDLSRIYFASTNVLTGAEENSEGDVAQNGEPNLYLYEDDSFTFIATLAAGDHQGNLDAHPPSPLHPIPRKHTAYATDDGSALAFPSLASLTGEDNREQSTGEQSRQVYLYDAEADELRCASCNPGGARPVGADLKQGSGEVSELWTSGWIPSSQRSLYERRPLSEDGNRLFFNSLDALVPNDINGAQDVYQWEAPGSGDCTEDSSTYAPRNEGCIALISSGQSPQDSEFVDASASGDDVFIRTASSLVPQDDGLVDIYDARVEGGFEPPPPPPADCQGDACQPAAEQPDPASPGSEGFEGAEDPAVPADCRQPTERAKAAAKQARKLQKKAKRAKRKAKRANGRKAKRLRKQAKRQRKQAKAAKRKSRNLSKRARACRSQGGS